MALDLAGDDAQPVELFQGDAGGLLEGRPGRRFGQPRVDDLFSDGLHARCVPGRHGRAPRLNMGTQARFFSGGGSMRWPVTLSRNRAIHREWRPLVFGKMGLEVHERGPRRQPAGPFHPAGCRSRSARNDHITEWPRRRGPEGTYRTPAPHPGAPPASPGPHRLIRFSRWAAHEGRRWGSP